MNKTNKTYIAGHGGMVGSALLRTLRNKGYESIITRELGDLDLRRQAETEEFFLSEKPDIVFLAAAKVGGIAANNTYPAEFIYDNLAIQTNVIHAAYRAGVKRLLFLGSSCIYPKLCPQPIKEEYLLTGSLEPTNEAYALAKIAGLEMCKHYNAQYGVDFVSVMPTNLYGENDNFNLETSHVLPALLRKFHEAKQANLPFVEVWGSGTPRREFLHVNDMAEACVHVMENPESSGVYNVGCGEDVTIRELTELIGQVVGYQGDLKFDSSKPDGTPRKLLDISRITELGWKPALTLEQGIKQTYAWYCESIKN
ncbi:MAG: GDP-L-fucose synthase [Oscillospiraceae bacterium]|jgi:GDP-L-fucose synthase|nr:GDP-L-fucose synthase [Oscillospiraceae bacterium]